MIDLSHLPVGLRYEDTYGGWLETFRQAAISAPQAYRGVPRCWAPFLYYLGHAIESERREFPEDCWVSPGIFKTQERKGRLREYVEVCSAMRPELVDALWKADMEWLSKKEQWRHKAQSEFPVTCNGSFFRPEVLDYLSYLKFSLTFHPSEAVGAVLVPCAADKPYPARVHTAVKSLLRETEELVIVTGVLGVVPEALWGRMPRYDSGLPNERRVTEWVGELLAARKYKYVVSYCDFYNPAISEGDERGIVKFVFPVKRYIPYQDLLSPRSLTMLGDALKKVIAACQS